MAIPDEALIRRHHDVLQTEIDGEVLAMSVTTGRSFSMGGAAGRIWHLVDQPCRLEQLIQQMIGRYEVSDRVQCRVDVHAFVEDLVANHLAVVSAEPTTDSSRG